MRFQNIDFFEPMAMAILNVTPDSFYSGSRNFSDEKILKRVEQVIDEGASVLDIGGYSSRPNAEDVSPEEEWTRVERGIRLARSVDSSIPISIDTFRSEVALRAVEQFGEVIINDISAGEIDPQLMQVAAKYNLPYVAMHMRGTPQSMQSLTDGYSDVVEDVVLYFRDKIKQLNELGVANVVVDPGFGFSKDLRQNYQLMSEMYKLKECGAPILAGISRKSMIYKLLDINPKDALTGTIALHMESLRQGATILRVHDVKEAVQTIKIFNALNNRL